MKSMNVARPRATDANTFTHDARSATAAHADTAPPERLFSLIAGLNCKHDAGACPCQGADAPRRFVLANEWIGGIHARERGPQSLARGRTLAEHASLT
jgi:hypothetical protein